MKIEIDSDYLEWIKRNMVASGVINADYWQDLSVKEANDMCRHYIKTVLKLHRKHPRAFFNL
jgi:hypothetical protein